MAPDVLAGVRDRALRRPDGRTVAWSEYGDPGGRPLVRVPGTPGCRLGLRADRSAWDERGLHVITTERPGFGASTPLPGRGFVEPADDIAAILDRLGIDAAHVIGGSGSAPHQLAFAARHPDRVRAMTVLVGAAPMTDDEAARMLETNRRSLDLVRRGDVVGLRGFLGELRSTILADPLAAFRDIMAEAPESDRAVMTDPRWQATFVVGAHEALRSGVDGWVDETIAINGPWRDVDLDAVTTSLTWWHAGSDANCPLSAARRLVERLPNARLVLFGDDEGHLAAYHREAEILDELLARS